MLPADLVPGIARYLLQKGGDGSAFASSSRANLNAMFAIPDGTTTLTLREPTPHWAALVRAAPVVHDLGIVVVTHGDRTLSLALFVTALSAAPVPDGLRTGLRRLHLDVGAGAGEGGIGLVIGALRSLSSLRRLDLTLRAADVSAGDAWGAALRDRHVDEEGAVDVGVILEDSEVARAFLRGLTEVWNSDSDDAGTAQQPTSVLHVRELSYRADYGWDGLARVGCLLGLRRLEILGDPEQSYYDCAPGISRLVGLERLHVDGVIDLDDDDDYTWLAGMTGLTDLRIAVRVHFDVGRFVLNLPTSLVRIDLTVMAYHDVGIDAWARLSDIVGLRHLRIRSHIRQGFPYGATVIAAMPRLERLERLERLDLDGLFTREHMNLLAAGLSRLTRLRHLGLPNNDLGDTDIIPQIVVGQAEVAMLADAMEGMSLLEDVDLSGNDLTVRDVRRMEPAWVRMAEAGSLCSVDLRLNAAVALRGAAACIARMRAAHITVELTA
jgi:hypothetical protein